MENKKNKKNILKIFLTAIFALATFGLFGYVLWKGDVKNNYLSFAAMGTSLVFALLFFRFNAKNILLIVALALNALSFAFTNYLKIANASLIAICLLLGMELCFLIYTLTIARSAGYAITGVSVRAALCLLAYFILPNYVALTTLDLLQVMLLINHVVTLGTLLLHFKTQWLLFLGVLLLLVANLLSWLRGGGVEALGITGQFLDFLYKYDLVFIAKIPALFMIALSAVWAKKKTD